MNFTEFTPYEYLLINLANHFGLDKEVYSKRINFIKVNMNDLEDMIADAEEPELFLASLMQLRKVQRKEPVGALVSLDAVCSGIQILSALVCCKLGAKATGLINTGKRPNAYLLVQQAMERILDTEIEISYKDIKRAVMTSCYGSQAVPRELFHGILLDAFYQACREVAPGAFNMLPVLRDTWKPDALAHEWYLPDGHKAYVPVMASSVIRLEIDELEGYKMSTLVTENVCLEKGLSNIANVTHSIDAFILRCLIRYCNYDTEATIAKRTLIVNELASRDSLAMTDVMLEVNSHCSSMGWIDITLLDSVPLCEIPTHILESLLKDVERMLSHKSFPILPVHDCFSCHPNNVTTMRKWYNEILARLSESTVLQWILRQLYDDPNLQLEIYPEPIGHLIREANYAIN